MVVAVTRNISCQRVRLNITIRMEAEWNRVCSMGIEAMRTVKKQRRKQLYLKFHSNITAHSRKINNRN